jgi:hypothetical protein
LILTAGKTIHFLLACTPLEELLELKINIEIESAAESLKTVKGRYLIID